MENCMAIVVINQQHTLMPDQERVLNEAFGSGFERFDVPADGWTVEEMDVQTEKLQDRASAVGGVIVFASPIPVMIKDAIRWECLVGGVPVMVFHNDNREKKELPGGKIISVVAKTGWRLI